MYRLLDFIYTNFWKVAVTSNVGFGEEPWLKEMLLMAPVTSKTISIQEDGTQHWSLRNAKLKIKEDGSIE